MRRIVGAALAAAVIAAPFAAQAESRVTIKSAKAGTSYYVMIVQIGETLREASGGRIQATIEESQGSVQNVKEAARRPGNFIFTTPPTLIENAKAGKAPFEGETGYDRIRGLFVMPSLTVQMVVRADGPVKSWADLAGKQVIPGGRGTACEGNVKTILSALGIADKVELVDVELSSANNALRDDKVAGFGTCSSHPTPNIQELATTMPVRILSFSADELAKVNAAAPGLSAISISADTYKGLDGDVSTVAGLVGAFTTTEMSDDDAYEVTKIFWEKRDVLAKQNPLWAGVTIDLVPGMKTPLHPGAARYYKEAGVEIPAEMM